jgi:hypothetical protein
MAAFDSALLAHLKQARPMYGRHDLRWDGHRLRLRSGRFLATIAPDPDWSDMWRVHLPNGGVRDMVNLTRAKDAAQSIALASLNAAEPWRAA